jgi:hypothetical protein
LQVVVMKHIEQTGFAPPPERVLGDERRTLAFAQLIATAALTLCTAIAAIVVTVGIARADVGTAIGDDGSVFAIALMLGIVFIGIGGLGSVPRGRRH